MFEDAEEDEEGEVSGCKSDKGAHKVFSLQAKCDEYQYVSALNRCGV